MSGRALPPTSPFAGDDGSTPPELAAALAQVAERGAAAALGELVRVLAATRLLVPVLAEALVVHEVEGLQRDRVAAAGVVALAGPDGRQVLPVFSSVETMSAWRAEARPVPVAGAQAAQSAVAEGWDLLVLDPAGPVTVTVPRTAVWALAHGVEWRPAVAAGEDGTLRVDPEVASELATAALVVPGVRAAEALPGRKAEVALRLGLDAGLDRAGLDAVLSRVNARIAASELVAERVDSLELRIHAVAP